MRREVLGEHIQRGQNEAGHAVRVGTGTASRHRCGGPPGHIQGLDAARAVDQRGERPGDARQAQLAGPALPGGLPGQVARYPGHLAERAGPVAERQDDAGAERPADRLETGPRHRHDVGVLGRQPHPVVAADQHAVTRGRLADVENGTERHAGGHLDDCRAGGGSAHTEQDGAGFLRHADRRITLGPEQREHGELREGLGVGQQRRQAVHAALGRERLTARRHRALPVDGPDQGAALSRDEPLRHFDDPHQVPQARLRGDGRIQRPVGQLVARHPDDDLLGPDRLRRQRGTGQDQVGRPHQEHLVLEASWLALGGVDHHDRRLTALARRVDDGLQLAGGRECRAAVTAQIDLLRHRDELGLRQPRQPAEQVPVGLQVQPRIPIEPSGHPGCSDPHDGRGGGASRGSRLHRRIGDHRRSSPP